MEPITAINAVGLTCNVVQLVELTWKVVSNTRTIVEHGRIPEQRDLETVTLDLQRVTDSLNKDLPKSPVDHCANEKDQELIDLCIASKETADQLLTKLKSIQGKGSKGKGQSIRQALKTVWSKDELDKLSASVERYRTQLNTRLIASLLSRLDGLHLDVSHRLDGVQDDAKGLADIIQRNALLENTRRENQTQDIVVIMEQQYEGMRSLMIDINTRLAASQSKLQHGFKHSPELAHRDLFEAVRKKNYPQVEEALARNPEALSAVDSAGQTPLHYAVRARDAVLVRYLVTNGADTKARDFSGRTPQQYALHASVISWLLRHGTSLEVGDGRTNTLATFTKDGDLKNVQLLLDLGAQVDATGVSRRSALMEATLAGHTHIVKLLLEHGADPNLVDNIASSALLLNAEKGHAAITELLLRYGADINFKGGVHRDTALGLCSFMRHDEMAHILIEAGADLNAKNVGNMTPLLESCKHGRLALCRNLLDHGADADIATNAWHHENDTYLTALHYAARGNQHSIIRLLAEKGIAQRQLEAKSKTQTTPLIEACLNASHESARILLDLGADVHARDHQQHTPLTRAAQKPDGWTTFLLLDQGGADIDAQNHDGWTALAEAAWRGEAKMVAMLLDRGADASIANARGELPEDLAAVRGHQHVVRIFRDHSPL